MNILNIFLICCLFLIPEAISSELNRHCPMERISRVCTKGSGVRIFNSGAVWDPATAFTLGLDEHWNCIPCCQDSNYTLRQCQDTENIEADKIHTSMGNQAEKYQSPTGMKQTNPNHRAQNQRKRGWNQRGNNRRGGNQRYENQNNWQTSSEQEIQTAHCEISKILFRCRLNAGGWIPKNSGPLWNPDTVTWEDYDNERQCSPCCIEDGHSIMNCGSGYGQLYATDPTENGMIVPSRRIVTVRRNKRSGDTSNQEIEIEEAIPHCPMERVTRVCKRGSGDRIFNSGSVWDPATAFTVGIDEHWECIPCCKDNSFTLPQCKDGTEETEKISKDEEAEDDDHELIVDYESATLKK